jgi:hypothetical protein
LFLKYLGFKGVFLPNRITSALIKGYEPLDVNETIVLEPLVATVGEPVVVPE